VSLIWPGSVLGGGKILNGSRKQIFFFVLDGEEGGRLARHMIDVPTKVILSIDSLPNESDWMKDNLDKHSTFASSPVR
jgi:hypothetical protein